MGYTPFSEERKNVSDSLLSPRFEIDGALRRAKNTRLAEELDRTIVYLHTWNIREWGRDITSQWNFQPCVQFCTVSWSLEIEFRVQGELRCTGIDLTTGYRNLKQIKRINRENILKWKEKTGINAVEVFNFASIHFIFFTLHMKRGTSRSKIGCS